MRTNSMRERERHQIRYTARGVAKCEMHSYLDTRAGLCGVSASVRCAHVYRIRMYMIAIC